MAGRKRAEKAADWRVVVRRQAESGVSVRKFCVAEGISEPSFYKWRKRLAAVQVGDSHLPVAKHRPEVDQGPMFVPVRLLDSSPAMEIIHPLGYRIQLTGDVNPIALRRVIETLDARGMQ